MALSYEDLLLLNTDEWQNIVQKIDDYLKPQLQGSRTFIRNIKDEYEDKRKNEIIELVNSFANSGSENLDNRILKFTDQMKSINDKYQTSLQYDFINIIKTKEEVNQYLNLSFARDFLKNDYLKFPIACERLSTIILEIKSQSISQANRSLAGMAGENMVHALFNSVGLIDKIHYRDQYKSKSGSDTDFVLPNVEDFNDILVDAYVAVQFSTNDRARLASSELKEGGVRYIVTGNGLPASKKTLKDIGSQIIQNFVSKGIRLVCYDKEIEREKNRIKENLNPDYERLKYFETSAISFSRFADRIKHFKNI
jgi:hypothetical protein